MWAASPVLSWKPLLLPTVSSATTSGKPPKNKSCLVLAVSNKFRQRSPQETTQDDVGGLGQDVLTALQSHSQLTTVKPLGKKNTSDSRESKQQSQALEKQQQITGSDVIFALQKATALRFNKKKTMERGSKENRSGQKSNATTDQDQEVSWDYFNCKNVRPLCIKSHWTARLDQLERRLQELLDTNTTT